LPNADAYAESRARSAGRGPAHAAPDGDGAYADIIERALYNAIAAVSADGTHFFYANPLASAQPIVSRGSKSRALAAPTARPMPLFGQYAASVMRTTSPHLFVRGTVDLCVSNERVRLQRLATRGTGRYARRSSWTVRRASNCACVFRWARCPADAERGAVLLDRVTARGYARLDREWTADDHLGSI
jgi:DUF1680 family protein